jgi:hypothetical protein
MKVAVLITGQLRDYKVNCANHMEHLIQPNNADVFVYACSRNTMHTLGSSVEQKYSITSISDPEEIKNDIKKCYGDNLIKTVVNDKEELDDGKFGTLGYFKKRMNNQMKNIREGYLMAMNYSKQQGFKYDVIVRCRPDNSMFPKPVFLDTIDIVDNNIYSTVYPSGHRDPWFFSFSTPKTFDKYCSFVYMPDADGSRTDNNFDCPEVALEKYLFASGFETTLFPSICRPFYEYDKTKKIIEFPHVVWKEKLLDASGAWVEIRR